MKLLSRLENRRFWGQREQVKGKVADTQTNKCKSGKQPTEIQLDCTEARRATQTYHVWHSNLAGTDCQYMVLVRGVDRMVTSRWGRLGGL